jgi:hypothetical protein
MMKAAPIIDLSVIKELLPKSVSNSVLVKVMIPELAVLMVCLPRSVLISVLVLLVQWSVHGPRFMP